MIEVQKFIISHNLDKKEVAAQLFPDNQYPKMALKRVLDKEALLNSEQASKLAAMAHVSVMQLFTGNWDTYTDNNNKFTIESNGYKAELDMNTWTTRLFHKNSLFHEEVLTMSTISIKEYLHEISLRIAKHEFQ